MLYLLPLLFAVAFSADCNKIVYTTSGTTTALLTGQCQILGTTSVEYTCNEAGDDVDLMTYSSGDCSGDASSTVTGICALYGDDCTATCDGETCIGVQLTTYAQEGCTGDISAKINVISDQCTGGIKYTCNSGTVTQATYISGECSGDAASTVELPSGCQSGSGISIDVEGCDAGVTLKVFFAMVTVLIASLF
mmetsp:Transcript_10634/g.9612  ORF Transcript_10634/g.9612 Transcript_10634/m.9612 type:complete len:193 (-) Transcript_10634:1-579(-)